MFTKRFADLNKSDVDQAGGKGASLGEMTAAGIQVPNGFVVLASTFDKFIKESKIEDGINAELSSVDVNVVHTVDGASRNIKGKIMNAEVSKAIIDEIKAEFHFLKSDYVAIRSSATAEDGVEHAWAGQLSSFLNVTEEGIIEAIKECWASLFTPRAITYRIERNLLGTHVSVAVVVQKMVNSEKSGVAFSVNPINEQKDQIVIEAGFGLGEAVVSGEVTPDAYIFSKSEQEVIDVKVNHQTQALYRLDSSEGVEKTGWVSLDRDQAVSQVINDDELVELSTLIKRIEDHYGFPCDIEWAQEGGVFYITQCRPITTLSNDHLERTIHWKRVWEAGNAPVFEMTHGTLLAHEYMEQLGLVDYDLQIVGSSSKISAFHTEEGLQKSAARGYRYFLKGNSNEYFADAEAAIKKSYELVHGIESNDASTIDRFSELSQQIRRVFAYFNLTNPQFLSKIEAEILNELKVKVGEGHEQVFASLCVSEKTSSIQEEQLDWMKLVTKVQNSSGNKEALIAEHHDKYGLLAGDEGNQIWNVQYFSELLEKELTTEADYEKEIENLENYSKKIVDKKEELVKEFSLSDSLVKKAELLSGLGHIRLELRSAWTALFHKLRDQLELLSNQNKVEKRLLATYTADEIIEYTKSERGFEERSEKFSVGLIDGMWTIGFGEKAIEQGDLNIATEVRRDGEVYGNSVFPGVVEGKVVVLNWGDDDFEKMISDFPEGGILVAGQTRPMLVPAIRKAAAIVTDEGGITSHAAIVAREFEKPCVIGTVNATDALETGNEVRVDATNGVVSVLKK